MGIVHGAARGGDQLADSVARELGWVSDPVPCTAQEWARYGRSAGHRRSARMIQRCTYVGCVAFPLGLSPGTRGCMAAAADAGIRVWNRGDAALGDGLYRVTRGQVWCRNGLYEVADPRRPAGCILTSSPAMSAPWRAWNSQNDVNAASLRFTLAAEQWCPTVGSTTTLPSRAVPVPAARDRDEVFIKIAGQTRVVIHLVTGHRAAQSSPHQRG